MTTCKILSILHSGIEGSRDSPRLEEKYKNGLGVIVGIDLENLKTDLPLIISEVYADTEYHSPTTEDKIVSRKFVSINGRSFLTIETENTIYKFELI